MRMKEILLIRLDFKHQLAARDSTQSFIVDTMTI